MRIAVFGGSFNPPHIGHVRAAAAACAALQPDLLLVIPDCMPPHKEAPEGSPTPQQRLELCRLAFDGIPNVRVSDMEIRRGGKSYTADTLRELRKQYPDAELTLLTGTDMFLTLECWRDAEQILRTVSVGVLTRGGGETDGVSSKARELKTKFGTKTVTVPMQPVCAASTQIRSALPQRGGRELLPETVYAEIIRRRYYGANPEYAWLRERSYAMLKPKRIPHVKGCEQEAVRLAERWGADRDAAAEAAILHDCTKKEPLREQLILCEKYGIIPDDLEQISEKLLHAKTAAAIAEREFGMDEAVCSAIRWHTTGRAGMSLLEKIVYMADYIEPNRCFEGVEKLRKLAYKDLDSAMVLGFEMSIDDIRSYGNPIHKDTLAALRWYQE